MSEKFRFDFENEDEIELGEIQDKFNVLNELVKLRFDQAEEMQKGGIMQIKGVILGIHSLHFIYFRWSFRYRKNLIHANGFSKVRLSDLQYQCYANGST